MLLVEQVSQLSFPKKVILIPALQRKESEAGTGDSFLSLGQGWKLRCPSNSLLSWDAWSHDSALLSSGQGPGQVTGLLSQLLHLKMGGLVSSFLFPRIVGCSKVSGRLFLEDT